jgi:arylsulfatase A-like enzyme
MITRRKALQVLAGSVAAVPSAWSAAGQAGSTAGAPAILGGARRAGDKPNLLFLWTDEQRADTMAAYGNTRFHVPAMNRLASQSLVFDRPYVTQPVCTPSRSCIMTGWWPHQSGCVRNGIPLKAEAKTVPELVADSAYRTAYMGKWHLGDEIFAQHGFEEWKAIEDAIYRNGYSAGRDKNARSAYHHLLISMGYRPDEVTDFSRNFATKLPVEHTKPSFLANEASNFMLKHRSEPWILYVNFLEPHMPFASVLDDLHSEEEAPLKNFPGTALGPEPAWYKRRRGELAGAKKVKGIGLEQRAKLQRQARNYAGLCSLVDQALNRILWTLEATGQTDNTIIVYTSDHGEMMGAHGLMAKQVMYEEALRVPLLVRAPFRQFHPRHIAFPVSHIDLVPTVLELLGKKVPDLPGRSLVPVLNGNDRPDNDVYLEWTADRSDSGEGPNGRTVVSPDGYKLVLYDTDQSMLFDHNKDPQELNNVYGKTEYAQVQARLRKKIEGWQQQTKDSMALPA